MHFADKQQHAIPFFLDSNFLPVQMIYFEKTASLMHDVSNRIAPVLIRKLFTKTEDVHSYNTRSAYSGNFYVKSSRLETQKFSFSRSGSCIYNCLPVSLRNESKKKFIGSGRGGAGGGACPPHFGRWGGEVTSRPPPLFLQMVFFFYMRTQKSQADANMQPIKHLIYSISFYMWSLVKSENAHCRLS